MTPFPNNILHTIHCSTERTTTFANHAMHNWNKHAMYSQHPEGNLQIRFTLFRHYFCTKSLHSPTIYAIHWTTLPAQRIFPTIFERKNGNGRDQNNTPTSSRRVFSTEFGTSSVPCRVCVSVHVQGCICVCVRTRGFGGMCAHARSSLSAHEPSPFVSGTQTLTAPGDAIWIALQHYHFTPDLHNFSNRMEGKIYQPCKKILTTIREIWTKTNSFLNIARKYISDINNRKLMKFILTSFSNLIYSIYKYFREI